MAAREIPGLATVLARIDDAMAPAAAWCERRGVLSIPDLKELGDDEIEDFMEAAGLKKDFQQKLVKKRIMELTRPPPLPNSREIPGLAEFLFACGLAHCLSSARAWCTHHHVHDLEGVALVLEDVDVLGDFLDSAGVDESQHVQVWSAIICYMPSVTVNPYWKDDVYGETLAEHALQTAPRVFVGLDDIFPRELFSAKTRVRAVVWCESRAIYDVVELRDIIWEEGGDVIESLGEATRIDYDAKGLVARAILDYGEWHDWDYHAATAIRPLPVL